MKKVTIVFGTRPEAIKLAPVIHALKKIDGIRCKVCVTGQHRHMLDQVLDVMDIKPDLDLNLMQPNQTVGGLTARAIQALDETFAKDRPDLVLVQGDTTTVFCAALAASASAAFFCISNSYNLERNIFIANSLFCN